MKKFKLFALFCLFGLTFTSCGSDPVACDNDVFFNSFNDAINELNLAVQKFGSDPTKKNCEDYVKALDRYIDEITPLRDCAREVNQLSEFDSAIQQAKESIDDIECI